MIDWIRILIYKFKYRNYTPQQKQEVFESSLDQLKNSWEDVKQDFQNEPATRELIDTFDSMDTIINDLGVKK